MLLYRPEVGPNFNILLNLIIIGDSKGLVCAFTPSAQHAPKTDNILKILLYKSSTFLGLLIVFCLIVRNHGNHTKEKKQQQQMFTLDMTVGIFKP